MAGLGAAALGAALRGLPSLACDLAPCGIGGRGAGFPPLASSVCLSKRRPPVFFIFVSAPFVLSRGRRFGNSGWGLERRF
jgi:hypothetical protein